METVVYTCDRCGETIVGKVYNLVMDSIKADNVKYQLCSEGEYLCFQVIRFLTLLVR